MIRMIEKRFTEEYNERDGIYLFDNLMREKFYLNPVGLVDRCNSLWERIQRLETYYRRLMKEHENLKIDVDILKDNLEINREIIDDIHEYCQKLLGEKKELRNLLFTSEKQNEDRKKYQKELHERNEQLTQKMESITSKNKILLEHCDDLQERNDRQAKQLDNIYNLIEKQDWGTLQGLIEEFQECEEQLKIEMECYDEPTAKRH